MSHAPSPALVRFPWVWALVAALGFCGCHTALPPQPPIHPEPSPAGPPGWIDRAWLWKPPPEDSRPGLAGIWAPLLMWETDQDAVPPLTAPPSLYASEGFADLAGGSRPYVVYLWQRRKTAAGSPSTTYWEGFRIWLGRTGHPLLWDTLATQDQPARLYVARHWEQAAIQHFGPAQPPRRFAVEKFSGAGPLRATVAEIFDDAPLPMGPIAHVSRDGAILSLICRCSPARVRALVGQSHYQLWSIPGPEPGLPLPWPGSGPWLPPRELERRLRWLPEL